MNADNYYVNARELFLLCAIRKGAVEVINVDPYEWTVQHETMFQNQLNKSPLRNLPHRNGWYIFQDNVRAEARNMFGVIESGQHSFEIGPYDKGRALFERDTKMAWFNPGSKEESFWYQRSFRLIEPLTEEELFIVRHYVCS